MQGNATEDTTTHIEGSRSESHVSGSRVTRRRFLEQGAQASLGATALGSFLAACGSSNTGSTTPSGPVTLQYAALSDQTGEQAAEIAAFNKQNQGKINVQYLQLPPVATDQYSKFVNAFRAQAATPDVVHIDVTWPAQFAVANWLAPLDQYITGDFLTQFWPSAINVGKINGKQYGIQRYMDIGLLYYRTDLVEKYGQGVVPQTRDEMEAMAKKIMAGEAKQGLKYGYLMPGKKIEAIVDQWLELLWGDGGTIGDPGKLVVNGSQSIASLQYLHDLIYSKKLAPQGTNTYVPNDILNLFSQGLAPFMRNWTSSYAVANNPAKSKVAGKVGIAPTLATTGNKGQGCTGGWVLGINSNSQHKDEAWKFIEFLLSKETQTSMAQNASLVPSRPDVASDTTVQAKHPQLKQLATILNQGHNRPALRNYNQFTTPLQTAINSVLSNQLSAADALNGVQTQIASIL